MQQNQAILIGGVLILSIIGLHLSGALYQSNSALKAEFLNEPVQGETNTLQVEAENTELAGETLYINGEKYGQLNKAGITQFQVPKEPKIEIKVAGKTKTVQTQENNEKGYTRGINLASRPVQGEINQITLIQNGERIRNETIYINNEKIGETNKAGTITFTTPQTDELKIQVDKLGIDDKIVPIQH